MASASAMVLSSVSFAASAHAEGEVPIVGQAQTTSIEDTAETTLDVLISVRGVRRLEGATMVYWSVGYTPDSTAGQGRIPLTEGFGSQSTLSPPRGGTETMGDVAVADKKACTTLYTGDTMDDCVCQAFTQALPDNPAPGTAYVASAALVPIPQDVETVTLRLSGQLFLDIPVGDGPMEPVAMEWPIVVGMGWPAVDTEAINKVSDPSEFVVP